MEAVSNYLLANVPLVIFLCLGLGYLLGKIKIGSFTVGATLGTLVVGLLIGQLAGFKIDDTIKTIFFSLFIFTIGYEVGPSFVRSLKTSGVKIVVLSIVFAAAAFGVGMACFKAFNVGAGEAAGIFSGALTQSAIIGTSTTAIQQLSGVSDAAKQAMTSDAAIAYACTYVFGTAGVIVLLKNVAPKILRVDLKSETKELVEKLHYHGDDATSTPVSATKMRAFTVGADFPQVGKTVVELERAYKDAIVVEALFRDGKAVPLDGAPTIAAGDVITLVGNLSGMVGVQGSGLTETDDAAFQAVSLKQTEIMLTRAFSVRHLADMDKNGIMIVECTHDGNALDDLTRMAPGDTLKIVGPARAIAKLVGEFGYEKVSGDSTDVSYLGFGIALGLIVGALEAVVGGVPLTLGGGGGALVCGLVFGWYADKHPRLGLIPKATRWLLKSLGLNLFIAIVGLNAGADFVKALQSMGVAVLLIGIVVSVVPHIISILFGKYVLKLNAVDIIGGLCGAGTITAGLNAVSDEVGSSIFALSYTPGYAMGNILLTLLGPLAIALLR